MKKILNHLSKEWYKYILEMIVITAGILGAYMLNDWSQNRKERQMSLTYLENLKRDLDMQLTEIDQHLVFEKNMMSSANYLLGHGINVLVEQRSDSLHTKLSTLMIRLTFLAINPTFQDMKSTGNLRLLKNVELRRSVIIYHQDLERLESIIGLNNTSFVDGIFNNGIIDNDFVNMKERFVILDNITMVGFTTNKEYNTLLNTLAFAQLDNPESQLKLNNLVKARSIGISVHLAYLAEQRLATIQMLKLIEKEIVNL